MAPVRPNVPPIWPDDPGNVGRLPRNVPGNLSELWASGAPIRVSAAGVLPSPIVGNFNNIRPDLAVPYGSVGFTLICRSASNFTTILAILHDYLSMGYTEELNGPGAGTVSLDRDDPLLEAQLVGGEGIEDLLAKDNLWEVYFDGQKRFQWIGQTVQETFIDGTETRKITISGPGMASTLEWAVVLPSRFPAPRVKLETFSDNFVDQDIDIYGRWIRSSGTVLALDGRAAVRVTAAGGLGSYLASEFNAFDFVDSGIQVRVVPRISPAGTGRVRTFLDLQGDENNYIRMFVDRDPAFGSNYTLVAETKGINGLVQTRIPFDTAIHHYWRIQELDSQAIFSYRTENTTEADWVEFARLPYSFDASSVQVRLRADGVAGSNITFPLDSYFSLLNTTGVASPVVPCEKFRRLIVKAQQRGTIKHIIADWNASVDSMGYGWLSNPTVDVSIGANLLAVLNDVCEAQQSDWFMLPDSHIVIRQRVSGTVPDPTAPYHKENKVIFYESDSQKSKTRSRNYSGVRNYVVGKTDNEEYSVQTDTTSIGEFQQREILSSNSLSTRDVPSLQTVLSSELSTSKTGVTSWTLTVPSDVEGRRLYEDYELGDWVSVQTAFPFRTDVWRIAAIAVQSGTDGEPEVELTLNDTLTPFWQRIKQDTEKNKIGWINPPKPRTVVRYIP